MKLLRVSAAAACSALVVTAAQAGATPTKPKPKPKPKPVARCHLVTDPAGDANAVEPHAGTPLGDVAAERAVAHAGPSDDALDILGIDLATSSKTMVVVMQVKRLVLTSANPPAGLTWRVHVTIRSTAFKVAAHTGAGGTRFDATYVAADGSTGVLPMSAGIFDPAHNEIRFVLPVAEIAKHASSPLTAKITGVGGLSGQEMLAPSAPGGADVGYHPDVYNAADATEHDGSYTPGKPSRCG